MSYNSQNLYSPDDYQTLENRLFEAYNLLVIAYGYQPITFEKWKQSNIKFAFETNLEIDLQSEITSGLLYENIVKYLINNRSSLQQQPFGCTTIGISNAFMSLDGMKDIAIDQPNRPTTALVDGSYSAALDFDPLKIDDNLLFSTFLNNNACGIKTIGDKSVTGADSDGVPLTFNYTSFNNKTINVKLFFKYDNNFYGNKLSIDQVIAKYIEHFNAVYKKGDDIKPAVMNDISYYPSLAYLDSLYSIDGGTTWDSERNTILYSAFNDVYTLNTDIPCVNEGI